MICYIGYQFEIQEVMIAEILVWYFLQEKKVKNFQNWTWQKQKMVYIKSHVTKRRCGCLKLEIADWKKSKKFSNSIWQNKNLWYIKNHVAQRAMVDKKHKIKKSWKKFETWFDKLKNLWYIKEPSRIVVKLFENWIVRCNRQFTLSDSKKNRRK